MKAPILVVDDDHSSVSVITEVLEREEYQLFVANGGQSATKILEQERINLVITDLQMPDMDGITLLTSVDEKYIGHPVFEPIYSELDRLIWICLRV